MHVWMLEVFLVICFHVTKSNIKNYNCLTALMHIITLMRVMYLRYRFESITRDRKGPFFGLSTLCCAWAWMLWQDSCLEMFTTHPLIWNAHSVECSQLIRSLEMFVSHSITHSFSFKSTRTGKEIGLQEKKAKKLGLPIQQTHQAAAAWCWVQRLHGKTSIVRCPKYLAR